MNLLDNAVRSIQIGLEDYDDKDRVVSSIRNVHAGILLLFKERLRQLSPAGSDDVLVKQRIIPVSDGTGQIKFVGKGKNTIDVNEIKERFNSLGIKADWSSFESLTAIRNNVEHLYSADPIHVLQEAMSKALAVASTFVRSELNGDPAQVLGNDYWQKLLQIREVFDREKAECMTLMSQIDWGNSVLKTLANQFECKECSSTLLAPVDPKVKPVDLILKCRACGTEIGFDEHAEQLLDEAYWGESHEAYMSGDSPPLFDCPECGEKTFVADDQRCIKCGYECEFTECAICNTPLGPDDQEFGGLCSYHSYVMDQDD